MHKLLFIVFLLIPIGSFATVDLRLGGGIGIGVGNNSESVPLLDGGGSQTFRLNAYNVDLILSEYWLVLGARVDDASTGTGTFFYFDNNDNQYTKYGIKSKKRTFSAIVGFNFEINTPVKTSNVFEVLYSAGLFGVIPFDQTNEVQIESRNAISSTITSGSALDPKQWSIYLEATRAVQGGFVTGIQAGYKHYVMESVQDNSGSTILDYQGNELKLDLSHLDFKIFIGFRF